MNRWLIIICFFLLITSQTFAQQLIFKSYTVEDGLVSNPVRRIYQDSKGFIWICTWEGLSKYDGHKFTNYTTANGLSHNMVNDIYESEDGKLYVAENNGTVDILQQDAVVKKAAFKNVIINQFYITQNHRVIAATDYTGLHEIKNGNLVKPSQPFPGSTYGDISELNDTLLIGGGDGWLHILNRQFELFSEIKLPKELLTLKIYKDSKNKVWVGTTNGLKLVSELQKKNLQRSPDGQSLHFTLLPAPFNIPALKNGIVNDILEDPNGNFWIATRDGLVKIQPDNKWQLFSEKNGLPSENISCLYQDKEKNIWIGSALGLAKLVTKNGIRIYTVENGLISNALAFLLPLKNELFMIGSGTGTQLYNTTNGLFSSVSSQHNLSYNGFVQNSRPVLFFSNNNRFAMYDSVNRRIVDYILPAPPNSTVYCSIMDADGIIFNGTQTGLVIRAGKSSYNENKLPYRITDLLIDKKGFLWAGTWDNGLFRIHYTNSNDKINVTVKNFTNFLQGKHIRCLFEDSKGNIWIGTRYQGIVQLRNNGKEQYTAQRLDIQQGLMSNWVKAIAEDTKGSIWIGSNLGIDKLIPEGNAFRVFNFSRVHNYFANINALLPQNNHSLWFTTNNGLVNIIDGEMEKTPPAPVYITSVNLGDTAFKYNTYHPASGGTKVQLKYFQNQAEFEFSAPAFINEKQILYSYRLLGGADTTWSVPANLHKVSYASLQPGSYRFEVRTKGWNEQWGIPSNFVFNISPPYWQTWWFYSLIGLLALTIFYAFYVYRIKQLLRLQQVRNRIASDLHDDIGSTLTNISILSELSNKNMHQPQMAQKYLQRINEEVNTSAQALDDIIWNVNNNNDTLEEMVIRMRRFSAELFDHSSTICNLELQPDAAGKKLNMEQRRDVYLVYKESLNNIYKHAAAQTVWVELKMPGNSLKLMIRDDGKGFNIEETTHRNGLKNLKTRVEKWKGKLQIASRPGAGSLIEIIMPVEN